MELLTGVMARAFPPLIKKSVASTPVTDSLKVTVICVRLFRVLPAGGLTLATVGGTVSTAMDSNEVSKPRSLLLSALWKTWMAMMFVPAASDKIRKELGWTPEHDDLDLIVGHALAWEKHLGRKNDAA